jgi:hypothetical protein
LAQVLGLISDAWDDNEIQKKFGIRYNQMDRIFYGEAAAYKKYGAMINVPAAAVADQLEKIGRRRPK